MLFIRAISLLAAAIMTVAIVVGFLSGGFFYEGSAIWALWWGKVTLIDLYIGLVFFGLWVSVRERRPAKAVAWWVGLVVFGNLAVAIYLVYASFTSSDVHALLAGEGVRPNSAVIPELEVGP